LLQWLHSTLKHPSVSKLLIMCQILFLWHIFIVPGIVPHSKPFMACFQPFHHYYAYFITCIRKNHMPSKYYFDLLCYFMLFIHMDHIYPWFIRLLLIPFSLVLFPYFSHPSPIKTHLFSTKTRNQVPPLGLFRVAFSRHFKVPFQWPFCCTLVFWIQNHFATLAKQPRQQIVACQWSLHCILIIMSNKNYSMSALQLQVMVYIKKASSRVPRC